MILDEDPKLAKVIESAIWQKVKGGADVPKEVGENSESN